MYYMYTLPQSVMRLDARRTQIDPVFRLDAHVQHQAASIAAARGLDAGGSIR